MLRRVVLALIVLAAGCRTTAPPEHFTTVEDLPPVDVAELIDRQAGRDTVPVVDVQVCEALASQTPGVVPAFTPTTKPFNVLVLSGGGAYGAYSAGVLAGWTEAGTRPQFDVVTGVSTGALVATLAFLGPSRDPDLKRFYTQVTNKDVYARRSDVVAVFSDSFADSRPLARLIDHTVDEAMIREVAAEHAKGRRLYVGTTHLQGRRLVVWDMGAIATRATQADLALFRRVLLASASIPGFFPPVTIPVDLNGRIYEELHVDGGVTASLFFRPPQVRKELLSSLGDRPLAGSNLYVIVAGKLFADPGKVDRRLLHIAETAISALLYAQTRGDLFQLYALCLATGMNYRIASIPPTLPVPNDSTSFNPQAMTQLYEAGRAQAKAAKLWRASPPGTLPGEEVPVRGGIRLAEQTQKMPAK